MKRGRLSGALTRPTLSTMFLVVALIAVMVAGLFLTTRAISQRSYRELERREVHAAVKRAEGAIANRVKALSATSADYALWDDTYAYVRGENPSYLDDNFLSDSMKSVGVDFMAVVDPDNRSAEGRSVGTGSGESRALPGYVKQVISSARLAEAYDPGAERGSGVIATSDGPLLFATTPITNTDRTKSLRSYLMTGRLLDAREIGELSGLTQLRIASYGSNDDPRLPAGVRAQLSASDADAPAVVPLSDAAIAGYRVIPDVTGRPALTLGVTIPRTISGVGADASRALALALGIFGVITVSLVGHAMLRQSREVVERTRAEETARASEQRYAELFNHMADAVVGIDSTGLITFANPRAAQLTGLPLDELIGMHYSGLFSEDGTDLAARRWRRTLQFGVSESFEAELVRARGERVPVEVGASPLVREDGSPFGVQWIVRDVTDRKRFELELLRLASRDHLTGLHNRRRFEEELTEVLIHASRTGATGAVLWFDLDHFKDINDSLGHGAGDEVLTGVASTLDQRLRMGSMLARIGGDEFAVLLPNASEADAAACAERIIEDIRECVFYIDRGELRVTASVGVVVFPAHATTTEEILARADLAMYRAKEGGRNQYCVYRPDEDWQAELQARFDWTLLIEQALRNDRFLVYAQPVIDLVTGEVDRHELLIRMEDVDGGIVPPGMFLTVAERTGQISQIDQWMVRRAIDMISMEACGQRECRLDVNLSGRAFSDPNLLPLIQSELIRTGVDPSLLGVEITETAAVADMGKARQFIETLKGLGCRVALDDFGSGFSSFYYLRNLPIDCLKIDGSFVQNMAKSRQDQHVVRAIVELAAGFGISSTAEFVEDAATLQMLREFGVTYAQGFHIAKPAPSWGDVPYRHSESA